MGSPAALAARYGYPTQYQAYDTQFAGAKEAIGWTWWDTATYTSAATTTLAYFTTTKATLNLSNMEIGGQLASPKAFFLRALRVKPYHAPYTIAPAAPTALQTGVTDDFRLLLESGVLQLTIGQKVYGQWPLWMLPAGGGIVSNVSGLVAAEILDYANNGLQDSRVVYSLTKPLFIAPQINFRCDLIWPAGAVTLVTGNPVIWVGIDGDLIRPVQ